MKKSIRSLFALIAMGALALGVSAQPAPKILVVDMGKLHDGYYKAQEHMAKLQAEQRDAEAVLERLNKELDTLVADYKNLQEQTTNAALSADAKSKASNDAQKKMELIQQKQNEGRSFIQQSTQTLQQRAMSSRGLLLEEITKVATDIAKRKGATLLIDKGGPSGYGIPNLLYSDAAYEITDEVLKELNKDRPAGAATAPAATTPSATAPATAPAATTPTLSLPLAPKK